MSIIRQLVTKLSFKVDKSGLDKFEKSITGFKTKITAATAAISATLYKTISFFSALSKTIQDTDQLARNTNTATENVIKLQKALSTLGLPEKKFQNYFQRISDLLYEARSGRGELFEIRRLSDQKLDLAPFIESHDVRGALFKVFEHLESLNDDTERKRTIQGVLADSDANDLLSVISRGTKEILAQEENNAEFAKSYADATAAAREFNNQLNYLTTEFSKLVTAISIKALPALTQATEGLIEFIKQISKVGALKATAKLVTPTLQKINDNPVSRLTRPISDFFVDAGKSIIDFFSDARPAMDPLLLGTGRTTPMQINNEINVQVPPGTNEEMAVNVSEAIRMTVESMWQDQTRQIIGNNPQVE